MPAHTLPAFASLALIACAAHAQPALVITSINSDLSASGDCVVGWAYDGSLEKHALLKWTRGAGYSRLPGFAPGSGGAVSCSADGSILGAPMDNTADWGSLNCFPGYDAQGNLRVLQSPCSVRAI
ncbi:MAG TPA: hypothetical protein VFF65_10595, partial [Phycisphaerales bacterium]|nr:hypothetical protein [Phycisphaerales bacterium]